MDEYMLMKPTSERGHFGAVYAPGTVLGYSKNGQPIRAAAVYAPGTVLGYNKNGQPIRAASASIIDDMVCGGSSILFVGIGLLLGWLVADRFANYVTHMKA